MDAETAILTAFNSIKREFCRPVPEIGTTLWWWMHSPSGLKWLDNHSHDCQGVTTPIRNSWDSKTDCVRQWPSICLCWLCWICLSKWHLAHQDISIPPSIKHRGRKVCPHFQRSDEGRERGQTHPTAPVGNLSANIPHHSTFINRYSTLWTADGLDSLLTVGPSVPRPWAKSYPATILTERAPWPAHHSTKFQYGTVSDGEQLLLWSRLGSSRNHPVTGTTHILGGCGKWSILEAPPRPFERLRSKASSTCTSHWTR